MTETLVYLDAQLEHPHARENDELALHAQRIDGDWNGWEVPVVTADELRRFIAANARNDERGGWRPEGVIEDVRTDAHSVLFYHDGFNDEPDQWIAVGDDVDGNALYALDGWTWQL